MEVRNTISGPPEETCLSNLFRSLLWICYIYGWIATSAGTAFVLFGLIESLTELNVVAYWTLLAIIVLGILALTDFLVLRYHFHPLAQFIKANEANQATKDMGQEGLICCLNLPLLTVIRIMCIHGPIALLTLTFLHLFVGNQFFGTDYRFIEIATQWSVLLVVVPGHAILEYFAVQKFLRPYIPYFRSQCHELPPDDLPGVRRFNLRRKMLLSSIFITLVPLTTLGFTVWLKLDIVLRETNLTLAQAGLAPINTTNLVALKIWMISLIVTCGAVTISIASLLARDVSQLTRTLIEAMRRVEEGAAEEPLEIVSTDEFASLYRGYNRMLGGLQERKRLEDAFGRYLSPQIATMVAKEGSVLGGTSVHATVLFADIRGFTNLSERMKAQEIVGFLNSYFAAIEPAIDSYGGWINKFGGDSVLVIFGAPVPQLDHAQRAVRAALAIRKALAEFNSDQVQRGSPPLRIGVGIHSGWLVAGNVGSPNRMEYTVIGDAVNIASRLQTLTKTLNTDILISAEVYQACDRDVAVKEMPPTEVQGKSAPLRIYALM